MSLIKLSINEGFFTIIGGGLGRRGFRHSDIRHSGRCDARPVLASRDVSTLAGVHRDAADVRHR